MYRAVDVGMLHAVDAHQVALVAGAQDTELLVRGFGANEGAVEEVTRIVESGEHADSVRVRFWGAHV